MKYEVTCVERMHQSTKWRACAQRGTECEWYIGDDRHKAYDVAQEFCDQENAKADLTPPEGFAFSDKAAIRDASGYALAWNITRGEFLFTNLGIGAPGISSRWLVPAAPKGGVPVEEIRSIMSRYTLDGFAVAEMCELCRKYEGVPAAKKETPRLIECNVVGWVHSHPPDMNASLYQGVTVVAHSNGTATVASKEPKKETATEALGRFADRYPDESTDQNIRWLLRAAFLRGAGFEP